MPRGTKRIGEVKVCEVERGAATVPEFTSRHLTQRNIQSDNFIFRNLLIQADFSCQLLFEINRVVLKRVDQTLDCNHQNESYCADLLLFVLLITQYMMILTKHYDKVVKKMQCL